MVVFEYIITWYNSFVKQSTKLKKEVKGMENRKLTFNVEEMAKQLGVSRPTAYTLINSQDGPPVLRIGRRVLIPIDGLKRWLEQQSTVVEK